ncbi:MAG: hypothetical protein Q7R45_08400 [Sulfuricaulis sp.]|nr:hypothetical protein [Sulfuricaulis sp.]
MSRYNSRYWNNKPRRFSKEWWHNLMSPPWDLVDADGNYIWEDFSFSPTGGGEYVSLHQRSRYWNWWAAQP